MQQPEYDIDPAEADQLRTAAHNELVDAMMLDWNKINDHSEIVAHPEFNELMESIIHTALIHGRVATAGASVMLLVSMANSIKPTTNYTGAEVTGWLLHTAQRINERTKDLV